MADQGADGSADKPSRVGTEFHVVAADGRVVELKASPFVPFQAVLVLGPDMGGDVSDVQILFSDGRGDDVVDGSVDQAHTSVRG